MKLSKVIRASFSEAIEKKFIPKQSFRSKHRTLPGKGPEDMGLFSKQNVPKKKPPDYFQPVEIHTQQKPEKFLLTSYNGHFTFEGPDGRTFDANDIETLIDEIRKQLS